MPPSIFLTNSVIICISLPAFAQQAGVSGHVTDLSNNPLAECNISLLDTSVGTSADEDGAYSLQVPANQRLRILFSFVGFRTDTVILSLRPGENFELNVQMQEDVEILAQVEIISVTDQNPPSTITIKPNSVDLIPALFGDFSNIIRLLPGVVTATELSSGIV